MEVVTKRFSVETPVEGAKRLLRTILRLRGQALIPKGVYRFSSFEVADQWMIEEVVNTRLRLRSKTSSYPLPAEKVPVKL